MVEPWAVSCGNNLNYAKVPDWVGATELRYYANVAQRYCPPVFHRAVDACRTRPSASIGLTGCNS